MSVHQFARRQRLIEWHSVHFVQVMRDPPLVAEDLTEVTWEMRLLFLWVGLEALYGPTSCQETTHQLAEHIALLIGSGPGEQRHLHRTVKQSYG